MSESSGEKHFEATPARIAKARRDGNIARAGEFGANVAFVAAALAVVGISTMLGSTARAALLQAARGVPPVGYALGVVAWSCVPLGCAAIGGGLAAFAQNGGWQWVAVVPKLERLNPSEGVKRILSRETAMHALRATVAFAVSAAMIYPSIRALVGDGANGGALFNIASAAWRGALHTIFAAAIVGLVFAVVEFGMARRAWLRKLRMSFDELRREMREHDGDPQARGRRRALHRSFSQGAVSDVVRAAFVVANPTHIAIALEYRPPAVAVPRVIVSAVDEVALRVRAFAEREAIPIVENVQLARALLRDARVGEPIPVAQYVAVAEVVGALARSGALG